LTLEEEIQRLEAQRAIDLAHYRKGVCVFELSDVYWKALRNGGSALSMFPDGREEEVTWNRDKRPIQDVYNQWYACRAMAERVCRERVIDRP